MSPRGLLPWLVVLVVVGATIMQVSYASQDLAGRLEALNAEIRTERERLRVLEAEWAYLTRADRLQRLTEAHLVLQPTPDRRIARLGEVPLAAGSRGPASSAGLIPADMPADSAAPRPPWRPAVPPLAPGEGPTDRPGGEDRQRLPAPDGDGGDRPAGQLARDDGPSQPDGMEDLIQRAVQRELGGEGAP